jgi:hypothetical protein
MSARRHHPLPRHAIPHKTNLYFGFQKNLTTNSGGLSHAKILPRTVLGQTLFVQESLSGHLHANLASKPLESPNQLLKWICLEKSG